MSVSFRDVRQAVVWRTCLGAALLVCLTVGGVAQMQTTRTWDGGGTGNNWSTAGNWSADDAPDSTGEAALFANHAVGSTKLTPNLSADVTIGQLQFSADAPSYTITGTGASTLFLSPAASYGGVGVTVASGAANQTITAAEVEFLSSQTWNIGGTTTLLVTGTIEDAATPDYALTKNGTGTLVFTGDVRYDGPTTVNAGALVMGFSNTSMLSALTVTGGVLRAAGVPTTSPNALGSNATRNAITLAGGALELANDAGLAFGPSTRVITVSGNTTVRSDRLTTGPGVAHQLGQLRIGAQTLSVGAGGFVGSGTAGIVFGATTLSGNATFQVINSGNAATQLTLGAVGQSGTQSLMKTGTGTLRLNGAASYTGGTTLSQGAVTLGAANALGSGGLTFAGGALNANDTTDSTIGALAIAANSTLNLSPGGAAATLTFAGSSGVANGNLTITGWSGSAGGAGTNDRILFSGGTTPNADFLSHIRFDLGDGQTYTGSLGAGGELIPSAAGPVPVVVPDVVGQSQGTATAAVTGAGFVAMIATQPSSTVPSGIVIAQSPIGGTTRSTGATVNLVISSGATANITPSNVQSAQATASGSFIDLVYTVPDFVGPPLLLVVYGGAEASTTNLALPTGATFHGVAMSAAAQHVTPASGVNAGSGLYWLPVSPGESGTIRIIFTGNTDERAIGAVTLVGAAASGPEAVETAVGTASITDQIATRSPNAVIISTATQGNSDELTATGTGHVRDLSVGLGSSRMAAGRAEVASPSSRTLGYSGTINRIAMTLASFPVSAPSAPTVTLPDVTNTTEATAVSMLIAAGVSPGAVTTAYSGTVPAGQVISQIPAGGATVPAGSSVSLVVSLGAAPSNAPPIVSLTTPEDRASGMGTTVPLAVSIADTDATTVKFYGRKTVPLVPGPDFVIGTIPDTQFYSQNSGGTLFNTFNTQTQWYADSRGALNLAFISHLGDMVQNGDNGTNNAEWNIADAAMRFIEDPTRTGLTFGIPWGGAPGNHDQTTVNQINAPNAKWNLFFGANRWAGRPYFGGSFSPTNNSNNYELFEASGLEFLIIHLDYTTAAGVNQDVINWADRLMKTYPNRRAIVTSHWILNLPPTSSIGAPAPFGGPGQRFFDEFKDNPNFFLMLAGHEHGEGRRSDAVDGRTIYSILQDYQGRANGGNGWLRYFVFSPANNTITARTYSPTLNQFETDTDATSSPRNQASEFVLPYSMQAPVAPWTAIGTVSVPAGGGVAQVQWTGLETASMYEWFVEASDGVTTTTSGAWTFATAGVAAPTVTLTSPVGNAIFTAPATVTLTASADADGFVTKVEFFDGAIKLGEAAAAPYSNTWTNAPVGGHVLTAVVTDNTGATTTSAPVMITVNPPPNVPPTVTLTAPAPNATFTAPATVTLTATAGDTDGTVTKVEFFDGATKLGEATAAPFSYTWINVPEGGHVLTAMATDNALATGVSASVTITVNPNVPPTTETIWRSYDVTVQSGSPQAVVLDTTGTQTAVLELYESTTNGGVTKGALFGVYTTGTHVETFNNVRTFWAAATGDDAYPYAGKSTVARGADVSEANAAAPTGVFDLQLHPPNNAHLTVAAFRIPEAGTYEIRDLGVRRVDGNAGQTVRYRVFSAAGVELANLQATSRTWVRNSSTFALGSLTAGQYVYFTVDADGAYSWDATEIAWTVRKTSTGSTPPNVPPTVALTAPANGTSVATPGTVTLTATAGDTDGSVALVEFYAGITKLGEDATNPYSYTWTNPAAGSVVLTARATDDRGATTVSAPVSLTVTVAPATERIWRSYDVTVQSGSPQAVVLDTTGAQTAVLELYESTTNGGVTKGALFGVYTTGTHVETFNNVRTFWAAATGDDAYPYAGKSTVARGADVSEANAAAPTGVFDLQLHPPNNAHLTVAAFRIPEAGTYEIRDLGVRRVDGNAGQTVRYRVFSAAGVELANLQATSRTWVQSSSTFAVGSLTAGQYVYFTVDADGSYFWDATEIAWTVRRVGP